MRAEPIRSMLDAQAVAGWWVKPGPGYSPKYTGTVWELIFLGQLGADPDDPRIDRACDYVLCHTQAASGGFGASGAKEDAQPPPSRVLHCLNGNLIRALIGFGRWGDPRLSASVDWAARAITGEGADRYYESGTSGPRSRAPRTTATRVPGEPSRSSSASPGSRSTNAAVSSAEPSTRELSSCCHAIPPLPTTPRRHGTSSRPAPGSSLGFPLGMSPTCSRTSRFSPSSAMPATRALPVP